MTTHPLGHKPRRARGRNDIRTVHGLTREGHAIVRYERQGRWYIEDPELVESRTATVRQAAAEAARGTHFPGRPGGGAFDRLVQKEA